MKKDMKINLLFFLILITMGYVSLYFFDFVVSDDIKKMSETKRQLTLISKKIEEYYAVNKFYPDSISDQDFLNFLGDISIIDPFDSAMNPYRYIIEEEYWMIYSVGPDKINDCTDKVLNIENSGSLNIIVKKQRIDRLNKKIKNKNN